MSKTTTNIDKIIGCYYIIKLATEDMLKFDKVVEVELKHQFQKTFQLNMQD